MRFPSTTAQTLASPRIVYLKGADVRFSANDEPEQFAGDRAEQRTDDTQVDEVQRMRCLGAI